MLRYAFWVTVAAFAGLIPAVAATVAPRTDMRYQPCDVCASIATMPAGTLQFIPFERNESPPSAVAPLPNGAAATLVNGELFIIDQLGRVKNVRARGNGFFFILTDDAGAPAVTPSGITLVLFERNIVGIDRFGRQHFSIPFPAAIRAVVADRSGSLWIRTDEHNVGTRLAIYRIEPHMHRIDEVDLHGKTPDSLFLGADGAAYVTLDYASLLRLSSSMPSAIFVSPALSETPSGGAPFAPYVAIRAVGPDGALWSSDWTRIIHRHRNGKVVFITLFAPLRHITMAPVLRFRLAPDGSAWLARGSDFLRISPDDRVSVLHVALPIYQYAIAADGTVWYSSADAHSIVHFRPGMAAPNTLDRVASLSIWGLPDGYSDVRTVSLHDYDAVAEVLVDSINAQHGGYDTFCIKYGDSNGTVDDVTPCGRSVIESPTGYPQLGLREDGSALYFENGPAYRSILAPDNGRIIAIAREDDGSLWALQETGIARQHYTLVLVRTDGSIAEQRDVGEPLVALIRGADGDIYTRALDGALYRVGPAASLQKVAGGVPERFTVDRDGAIWFLRASAAYRVEHNHARPMFKANASALAAAPDGPVWIAHASSLCDLSRAHAACYNLGPNLELNGLFPQRDGSLWFTSGSAVVGRIVFQPDNWRTYSVAD